MIYALLMFVAVYLALFFPFAYFRHDDWLILGNAALKLPEDWSNFWKPTLFYGDLEVPWFFRPLFKLFTLFFYEAFEFNHYFWLMTLLAMLVVAILFAVKVVEMLTDSQLRGSLFIIAFCGSLYLHFGSLVWIGEGMMNVPQVLFWSLSTYFFVKGTLEHRGISFLISAFVSYLLALGFKETGVVHCGWLALLLFCEPKFDEYSRKQKIRWLAPYAVFTLGFLIWRMTLPGNAGSYFHYFAFSSTVKPLVLFIGPMVFIIGLAAFFFGDHLKETKEKLSPHWGWYAGFYLLLVVPFMGHGFFSPGWLLGPGFLGCWMFALLFPVYGLRGGNRHLLRFGTTLSAGAALAVTVHLTMLGWWQWGEGGKALKQFIESASDEGHQEWHFFDCPNPDWPDLDLDRVVAFEAGMDFLWRMRHSRPATFVIHQCDKMAAVMKKSPDKRYFWYEFPNLKELHPNDAATQKTALSQ